MVKSKAYASFLFHSLNALFLNQLTTDIALLKFS